MRTREPRTVGTSSRADGATLTADPTPPELVTITVPPQDGELVAQRYQLGPRLGRGGGGSVYKAFDRATRTWVAIKVLDPVRWVGARSAEQLFRELRVSRALNHPNVCRIHDVFADGERWLLTMEYAELGTLRATLDSKRADRTPAARLADARAVVAGLAAIHGAELVHRDLKPENILRLGDGRLAVSDFGLARALEPTTMTTGLAGTPGYLAPEILVGGRPTQAADVWALGLVLHEILVGARPEWDATRSKPILPSAAFAHAEERTLARLCADCLQLDPRRRPSSAIEVEGRLLGGLQGGRWIGRRQKVLAALAGLTLVGLVAGLAHHRFRAPPPVARSQGGSMADWSGARRLIAGEPVDCWQALPPRGDVVRMRVTGAPGQMIDIDLTSGETRQAPLPAQTYRDGCPALSPDGRSMLWTRRSGGRHQVMLASDPDGSRSVPLVDGSHAIWLADGRELLFVSESQRLARANLKGEATLFAAVGLPPHEVMAVSADDRSDLAAAISVHEMPHRERRLEIYDLRAMRLVRARKLEGRMAGSSLTYDPDRRTFLTPIGVGSRHVLGEMGREGDLRARGGLADVDLLSALLVERGLVLGVFARERSRWFLVRADGSEREIGRGLSAADTSRAGDIVYAENPDASSLGRVWLRRPGASDQLLAEGPGLGQPDISDDGTSVVYIRQDTGEFFHCQLPSASACGLVHVDAGLRLAPSVGPVGPDGDTVPYFAIDTDQSSAPRYLRVLSLGAGRARDLGRAEPRCPLRWASDRTVWIAPEGHTDWIETEIEFGRPTGRIWRGDSGGSCVPQPPGPGTGHHFRRESGWNLRHVEIDAPA
jgi:hypothetical protein